MQVHVHGHHPPALSRAARAGTPMVGPQRGPDAVDLVPVDGLAGGAHWVLHATLVERADGRPDLRGPWVHGRPGDRFLYLSWGHRQGDAFTMSRRAKLMLGAVDDELLRAAERTGDPLVAELDLTGADGTPVCAAVRPPQVTWTVTRCPKPQPSRDIDSGS